MTLVLRLAAAKDQQEDTFPCKDTFEKLNTNHIHLVITKGGFSKMPLIGCDWKSREPIYQLLHLLARFAPPILLF